MKKVIIAISLLALMVTSSFAASKAYINSNAMSPDELAILVQELKDEGVEEVIFTIGKEDSEKELEVSIAELVEKIPVWKEEGITEISVKEMDIDTLKTIVNTDTVSIDELETLLAAMESEGISTVKFMDASVKIKDYIESIRTRLSKEAMKAPERTIKDSEKMREYFAELKEKIPEEIKKDPEKLREYLEGIKARLSKATLEETKEIADKVTLMKVTKDGKTNLTVVKGPFNPEVAEKLMKAIKNKSFTPIMKQMPISMQQSRPGINQQMQMQKEGAKILFFRIAPFSGHNALNLNSARNIRQMPINMYRGRPAINLQRPLQK